VLHCGSEVVDNVVETRARSAARRRLIRADLAVPDASARLDRTGLAVAAQAHRVRGHARCEDPWACRLWNFQGCNWVLRRPAGRSDSPGRIRLVCICCSRISSPDTYCGDIQGASTRSAAANRQGTHPVHRLASAPPARRVRVARPGCCFASEFCETVSRSAAPWSACVMRVRLQHDAPAGPPCSAGFGRPSTVWLVL
jgi:hypothetical protein